MISVVDRALAAILRHLKHGMKSKSFYVKIFLIILSFLETLAQETHRTPYTKDQKINSSCHAACLTTLKIQNTRRKKLQKTLL